MSSLSGALTYIRVYGLVYYYYKERIKPFRVHRGSGGGSAAGIVFNPFPCKQERPLNNRNPDGTGSGDRGAGAVHAAATGLRSAGRAASREPPKLFRSTLKAFWARSVYGRCNGRADLQLRRGRGIYTNFAFERIGNSKYAYRRSISTSRY